MLLTANGQVVASMLTLRSAAALPLPLVVAAGRGNLGRMLLPQISKALAGQETLYGCIHRSTRACLRRRGDVKLIGIYSTEASAAAAISRLSAQSGFVDHPEGFHVERSSIDQGHWTEGFVTVTQPDT